MNVSSVRLKDSKPNTLPSSPRNTGFRNFSRRSDLSSRRAAGASLSETLPDLKGVLDGATPELAWYIQPDDLPRASWPTAKNPPKGGTMLGECSLLIAWLSKADANHEWITGMFARLLTPLRIPPHVADEVAWRIGLVDKTGDVIKQLGVHFRASHIIVDDATPCPRVVRDLHDAVAPVIAEEKAVLLSRLGVLTPAEIYDPIKLPVKKTGVKCPYCENLTLRPGKLREFEELERNSERLYINPDPENDARGGRLLCPECGYIQIEFHRPRAAEESEE